MAERVRVLVTGASGFVGRHVVASLRRGWPEAEVTEVARRPLGGAAVDLGDCDSVHRLVAEWRGTHVVHACGGHPQLSAELLQRVHVAATRNLLDALAASGMTVRFVNVGSSGQYAPQGADGEVDEGCTDEAGSLYAASKAAQEALVREAAEDGHVRATYVRLFNPVGSGQRPPLLVPSLLAQLLHPEATELRIGDASNVRDFFDVRDAADAIVACLRSPATIGERLNVCSGEGTSVGDLARRLATIAGRAASFPIVQTPKPPAAIAVQSGSRAKIESLCGWRPRYSLDDALAEAWREASAVPNPSSATV